LTAQQQRELEQQLALEPELPQALELEQQLALEPELPQEQVQVQVLQQALVLALHPHHRPLQSLFQQQRFHLQQLESLSMSLQSGMELRYLLCQLILRTMARLQQSCRQLF